MYADVGLAFCHCLHLFALLVFSDASDQATKRKMFLDYCRDPKFARSGRVNSRNGHLGTETAHQFLSGERGYRFQSTLHVTKDSSVARVTGPGGEFAVKFVTDREMGGREASIIDKLADCPHVINLEEHFAVDSGKYQYALVFKLYESAADFKPSSPEELREFMRQLLQVLFTDLYYTSGGCFLPCKGCNSQRHQGSNL